MLNIRRFISIRRHEVIQKTFGLNGYDIEAFSSWLEYVLQKIGVERQNCLRIRLSMEEAILRFRDRFGEDKCFKATALYSFGRPHILIELEEDAFNPLSSNQISQFDDWSGSLLTAVGLYPQYSYTNGKNTLRLVLPNRQSRPSLRAVRAIVIGIILGFAGSRIFGIASPGFDSGQLYSLIFDSWIRILNLLSGPVIFFMATTTVLGTGKIAEIGGDSKHVLLRYFLMSLLAGLLALVCMATVFGVRFHQDPSSAHGLDLIREMVFGMLPAEIFSPFMESNTPQLLVIAFILGSVLNAIGSQADDLTHLIKQVNMVGLLLTEWVGALVPIFSCVLIALEIMGGRISILSDLAQCMLAAFVVSALMLAGVLLYVSHRMAVPCATLIRKIKEPFMLTIITGSINEAVGQTERSCVRELGIEEKFAKVSLAYGWILYLPASIIGTLIFTIYTANRYGVLGGPKWFFIAVILSVVLFGSTPPVPGANLLAFVVIFSTLGIPGEALLDAMVFDIVFGIYAAAVNQAQLQLDLVLQAHKIRILNVARLKK